MKILHVIANLAPRYGGPAKACFEMARAVVIHEATASGLSVICSSVCGASVHLVQDGYNGYIVEPGNTDDLANAMLRYTKLSNERKKEMSTNSLNLSLQFTPERWAAYFYERIKELMQN